jgi:hypothetical protein
VARVVEILVFLNAVGGLAALAAGFVKRKRTTTREHIRQLEDENAELDELRRRIK